MHLPIDPTENIIILGLMSGTSCDGLDIALCNLNIENNNAEVLAAITIPYDGAWGACLTEAITLSAIDLARLNVKLGKYFATCVNKQLKVWANLPKPLAIASHGHTVHHDPLTGVSMQIGSGTVIATETGLPTIADFRLADVAAGGQGAPLVPIADARIFGQYAVCLNIGGIANLSYDNHGQRKAFDVCIANMLLNHLYIQTEEYKITARSYDKDGELASNGKVCAALAEALVTATPNLNVEKPTSLGREQFESWYLPLLVTLPCSIEDKLHTATLYVANAIAAAINAMPILSGEVLITGGGAYNSFLISNIACGLRPGLSIAKTENLIIDFKEALIFAYLGALRLANMPNALASVTGASKDTCGGVLYLP